ncbi:hypothetical protein H9X85_10760 [Anaerotignum lactatifermentans]|uniref:Phage XkdN-like protein n=1 Tax=Anaerotignum lactatifermentans TaxID=160404 RepID=A0ABS2GAV7_9FIRM|nr:hypothetical protein [Anaerotignum lactatifermentans]MBM6830017.1 hypothetical protein [Anaerotignum lactatifermentans]MBM6878609.1 hypothetical protein [Anaerotignum lactatifermentans]MBM6951678.1 hypothetical protein [Anaerotignum lactatifermentans]
MSILDKLLETDLEKLQNKEKKTYEVKRLSEILGEPFLVTCKPLTQEQVAHIGEISKNDMDMHMNTILECCEVEGKPFSHESFTSKFGTPSGKEVVEKMFRAGEVWALYSVVNKMSGYGNNVLEEVKN